MNYKDIEVNTETYDFVFIKNKKESISLEWLFVSTPTTSFTWNFNVGLSAKILPNENSLELKFITADKPEIKADCSILDSYALLKQSAIIRLKTALSELPLRPNVGSKLEELRHKEVNNKLISKIKSYCIESLEDIIPNINVEVIYDFNAYTRNIVIILRDGTTLLTKYKLEV